MPRTGETALAHSSCYTHCFSFGCWHIGHLSSPAPSTTMWYSLGGDTGQRRFACGEMWGFVTLAFAAYCRRQSAFNGDVPLPTQWLSALPLLVTRVLWDCGRWALSLV